MTNEFEDIDVDQIDVGAMLATLIKRRIESHERSQQKEIGASEIGTPCIRKLAFKIAQTPAVPGQISGDGGWRPTVGVAVHDWLADMLRAENARYQAEADAATKKKATAQCGHPWCGPFGHQDRFLVEHHTPIGTIESHKIPGNLDVYDRFTRTMVDWKIVGPTALKAYKAARHPGEQYRVQVQLYGRGIKRVGNEDVRYVAIMFLPANGELRDHFYWEEDFDPEVGKEALARARDVARLIDEEGESIFRKLKTENDHCAHCAYFAPGTTSPTECPGDPSLTADMDDGFAGLLGKKAKDD